MSLTLRNHIYSICKFVLILLFITFSIEAEIAIIIVMTRIMSVIL